MRVVIDFMNLVHAWLGGSWGHLQPPPDDLASQLNALGEALLKAGLATPGTVVVCDGAPPAGLVGDRARGVAIRFAGGGREADEVIEGLIAGDPGPAHLLVVSSDRRIQRAARRRRAHVTTSESFLSRLGSSGGQGSGGEHQRPEDLSPEEVEAWLKEFDIR